MSHSDLDTANANSISFWKCPRLQYVRIGGRALGIEPSDIVRPAAVSWRILSSYSPATAKCLSGNGFAISVEAFDRFAIYSPYFTLLARKAFALVGVML